VSPRLLFPRLISSPSSHLSSPNSPNPNSPTHRLTTPPTPASHLKTPSKSRKVLIISSPSLPRPIRRLFREVLRDVYLVRPRSFPCNPSDLTRFIVIPTCSTPDSLYRFIALSLYRIIALFASLVAAHGHQSGQRDLVLTILNNPPASTGTDDGSGARRGMDWGGDHARTSLPFLSLFLFSFFSSS